VLALYVETQHSVARSLAFPLGRWMVWSNELHRNVDEVANSRQRRSERRHGYSLPEVPQMRYSTCEQATDAEPQRCSSPQAGQAMIGGGRAMPATPNLSTISVSVGECATDPTNALGYC
jgi:hypothetical protein